MKTALGCGALLAAGVATGCSSASPAPHRPAQLSRGVVTIAFPNDLRTDGELSNGARIAVDQVNGLGGVNGRVKLRLLVRDTHGRPSRAARLASSLVAAGARVVLLPCAPASERAVADALRGRRLLMLATCNYAPLLARRPFLWAVGMGANREAAALADYALAHDERRIFVPRADTGAGRLLQRYILRAAVPRSLTVTRRRAGADVIVSVLGPRQTLQLRRRYPAAPLLATDLVDSKLARRVDGLTYATFGYPDPGLATDEFYERYRSYHGVRPSTTRSALGYAGVLLYAHVVHAINSSALSRVVAELRGFQDRSALGPVAYLRSGDRTPRVQVAIVHVRAGRLGLVERADPGNVPPP